MNINADPIQILTTGGTIDKLYFDALSEYRIGESTAPRILEMACVTFPFQILEVMRKDSLEISDHDRALLVEKVRASTATRIVITHGTDTMTKTAHALTEVFDKTIVLVGALTPARFSESDAAFNLGMAFGIAQIAPVGVYITMNGSVFRGDEVRKDRQKGAFVHKT